MGKVLCLKCSQELDPLETQCPVCLRNRSPREITAGLRQNNLSVRWRALIGAKGLRPILTGIVVLGAAAWAQRAGLLDIKLPQPAPAPAAAPETPVQAPPAEAAAPASAPETPSPKKPALWTVHGRAYDLITLKPIASARIVFENRLSGDRKVLLTSKNGTYSAELPPLAEKGYSVSVSHKRYGKVFLEEGDLPYRQMGLARRREESATLHSLNVMHVPILLPEGQSELVYDLVMSRP